MFEKYNIGIMGTGNIAGIMAETVKKMKGVKLYAVASRTRVKADAFAAKYGCKKAYDSYEDLVLDRKIDLIYIATPHSEHYENARLCILNGKPVLCEKAFTVNAQQAQELISLAREKEVFITEAMWIRYMPMVTTIQEVLGSGIIGELKTLTANLGYVVGDKPRLREPSLAGGALLDVGVYPLNLAAMLFGTSIEGIDSSCTYTETGVDEQNSITIRYSDGKVAVLNSSIVSLSDRRGVIYGTRGFAVIDNINNFEAIRVYDNSYKQVAAYMRPKQISGYEYEVEACLKALDNKELECVQMPHSETIRIMKIMDELRAQWGIVYPFEKNAAEGIKMQQKPETVLTAETQEETLTTGRQTEDEAGDADAEQPAAEEASVQEETAGQGEPENITDVAGTSDSVQKTDHE